MASPSETARAAIIGVPFDPNKKPDRVMTVKAFEQMEATVIATTAGAIIRPSLSSLNAVTTPPANQMAWVLGDSTAANNGVYQNAGTSGSPVWTRRGDLPYSIIHMINVGAGTPDAIIATSSLPAPSAPGAALFSINIVADNTGPVTINGKPLLTNGGEALAAGEIRAGDLLVFLDNGDHLRLLSDAAAMRYTELAQSAAAAAAQSALDALAIAGSWEELQDAIDQASDKAEEAEGHADQVLVYRNETYASEGRAQNLVDAAQAAYVGFEPGTFYDLGFVTDAVHLFPSDLGTLTA